MSLSSSIAFVKSASVAGFTYGEKLTGSVTRAYGTLANGVVDGIFPTGSVESFRSKAPSAAIRELSLDQDIDTTTEGLIDDAWKKEFYTNLPKTALTDRRQLLKRMKQVYRAKGNESSFSWLFQSLFNKEDIETFQKNLPSHFNIIKESLDEAEFKGKEVALGKPKRGGSKAYYVYVKDGDKVKKVTFGSGGLRAKIKNKEARNAFAARHKCKDKKDRTTAGYWSCNLPRYASQLGLGANQNTFW